MAAQRSSKTGRFVSARNSRTSGPKAGSHVKVTFGRREAEGVVVGQTITGRYSVNVTVPGADSPVTTTYASEDLRSANSE